MQSKEFRLAVDACRRSFDQSFDLRPPQGIDLQRFVGVCRRHRVQALAYNGLTAARHDREAAPLAPDAERIVRDNMRIAQESGRILQAFDAAGSPVLFLKGLALAAQVYPRPFLKMGWDIDILIAPSDLEVSGNLLASLGYRPEIPVASLRRWHRRRKESFWSSDEGFKVELHTALADSPNLLAGMGVLSPRHEALLPGGLKLPTLRLEEQYAYLCVHGASSAWFRLKWLVDLAALLHRCDARRVERLHELSHGLGAGQTSGPALLLAHHYFGTRLPAKLLATLRASASARGLAQLYRLYLAGRLGNAETTQATGGTIGIHLAQMLAGTGIRFWGSEACRQIEELITRSWDRRA